MEDCTQVVGTQDVYDPRRMGRNNSGLDTADISDVICILHPCTPAAFRIVSHTAERSPSNILQNHSFIDYQDVEDQEVVEEAETFILGSDKPHAMDLALRFSTQLVRPTYGFAFGRNPAFCDIVFDGDTFKRISNLHFCIFINPSGVLMLADSSTNGTVVDETILKGKIASKDGMPASRILASGSIIQILSPKADEVIKFIVRIPNREGYEHQYQQNFQQFMQRLRDAELAAEHERLKQQGPSNIKRLFPQAHTTSSSSVRAPVSSVHFGMHWSGGEKYSVVGNIGKGAFATVYQLATKTDGQLFAAKELDKRRCMKNNVLDRKVTNEMQIMQSVHHPNIVQYIEYRDIEHYLYIIMEFVPGGDLQQYLAARGALPEPVAKKMATQVLDALDYLHKNKITHRDIKPDNILLANTDPDHFSIKLSDFGLSKVVADDKETFLKTFCGTLLYCAPEVFPHYDAHVAGNSKKRARRGHTAQPKTFHSYSQSVDIWSFAAVLWYSLCLSPPFEGVADTTGRGMFDKIMMTPLDPTVLVRVNVSNDAIVLLVDMLNTDPAARPTPAACLQYKWLGGSGLEVAADASLGVIREEREPEAPDVGGLSLGEPAEAEAELGSQDSQLSISSGDIRFFDPRQSKRFKSAAYSYRDPGLPFDSSPEVMFDQIPIMNQVSGVQQPAQSSRKLFGEISRSELINPPAIPSRLVTTPGYSSDEQERALQNSDPRVHSQVAHDSVGASPSLLGAESLVRELKMNSPDGSDSSPANEPNEPTTPNTPNGGKAARSSQNEITPRPLQGSTFNRRISIPYPPSLFWESADPSTHNAEYAAKISSHELDRSENTLSSDDHLSGSLTDRDDDHEHGEEVQLGAMDHQSIAPPPDPNFVKPLPRLGKLISTSDSFASINFTLTRRLEDWGRAPSNTHVYPDRLDTRISKRSIIICFHANGIEKFAEDDDRWIKLPDLHAFIATEQRRGISINGVTLPRNEPNKHYFGRLYTGDEIEVYSKEGEAPLKFICEFFHGVGRESRPQNVARFSVEEPKAKTAARETARSKSSETASKMSPTRHSS